MSGPRAAPRPILYFGSVAFESIRQRPQQLALELARETDVVWVEPHRSIARALAGGAQPRAAAADRVPARLHRLDPGPVLPLSGYLPVLNRLNYTATARRIRCFLEARGLAPPRAIVASFPKQVEVLRHFPGVPVCYDVMDDYPLFFDRWQGAVLARMHRRLLAAAAVVIASSGTLAERCRPHARAVLRIGNGVSADFLAACLDDSPDPGIAALPRPRLGYVGTLGRWFDWDAVRAIAAGAPQGSVVLIGPGSAPRSSLPPNVRVLGPRPHAAIPAALRALDLGLIPFRPSPLVDAVNPVKLYEYLAAGLPVAASPFQEMMGLGGLVWICRTAADWAAAARRAHAEPADGPERARRRQTAAGELWSARAREFLAAIDSAVPPPRP